MIDYQRVLDDANEMYNEAVNGPEAGLRAMTTSQIASRSLKAFGKALVFHLNRELYLIREELKAVEDAKEKAPAVSTVEPCSGVYTDFMGADRICGCRGRGCLGAYSMLGGW